MKQRILSYRTPPCHRRPVTAHQCFAALRHFQTSTECCLEFARRLSGYRMFLRLTWVSSSPSRRTKLNTSSMGLV